MRARCWADGIWHEAGRPNKSAKELEIWLLEHREIYQPGGQRRRLNGVARATKRDMSRFCE